MVFLAAVVPPLLLLFSAWKLKHFTHHHNHQSSMASSSSTKQRWFPLESNPDLINKYIKGLGFDTSLYEFVDVFSTEDWALQMIPQPVVAIIMLYPLTEKQESCYDQDVLALNDTDKVWFIKVRLSLSLFETLTIITHTIQHSSLLLFSAKNWERLWHNWSLALASQYTGASPSLCS
jgi:hypothetical protein